jgi:signal transduction histidine kinase
MNRKVFFLLVSLLLWGVNVSAQEVQKSELQQRTEQAAAKAASLYEKANLYQEAFDVLRSADQRIEASGSTTPQKAALHYLVTKERMNMYVKMRRAATALDQLNIMENQAKLSGDESVCNDLLYTKAIYYYTFGQNDKGNAVFKEMADKLTAQKEYDKVDKVYQTLIANGRRSNSAALVAQSYNSYMAWKDSVNALKSADEIAALKQQIADGEASIAEKDGTLATRMAIIIGLIVLAGALAAVLVVGGIILLRYIILTRKQQKTIQLANESNALKAKFISNISAQLEPTFRKLDEKKPEVKALLDFSSHVQTLSDLENNNEPLEMEEIQLQPFCESLMDEIRPLVKSKVTLSINAPKMSAELHREYVTHILSHLLHNAAEYTPAEGKITLDVKKRGPHTYQFLVTDSGEGIPEEKREDIFKPFAEIRDLTKGDGLGLPTCKQMALKMNGDLNVDEQFVKGTRFILELHG